MATLKQVLTKTLRGLLPLLVLGGTLVLFKIGLIYRGATQHRSLGVLTLVFIGGLLILGYLVVRERHRQTT